MPGHKHQAGRQTSNSLQALLRSRRSRAIGLWPGPGCAQPPSGEVTATPSGHFGKAPSEQGTTFQGPDSEEWAAETQEEERKERAGTSAPLLLTEPGHKGICFLFVLKDWDEGTRRKARGEVFISCFGFFSGKGLFTEKTQRGDVPIGQNMMSHVSH